MSILIGVIFLAVVMGVFLIFALLRWPGAPDEMAVNRPYSVYGERVHWDAMIKQPINTWSNVAFVVFGFVILGMLDAAASGKAANPMIRPTVFSMVFACCVIFLGPGSMFFHASMTRWGGVIDNLSMNLYISFLLLYDVARLTGCSPAVFLVLLLVLNVAATIVVAIWDLGLVVFAVFVGLTLVLEILIVGFGVGRMHRQGGLLLAGLLVFAAAFIIWTLSKDQIRLPLIGGPFRGPLYMPDSWFQGHAVWHILSAVAAYLFFLYFRSETTA